MDIRVTNRPRGPPAVGGEDHARGSSHQPLEFRPGLRKGAPVHAEVLDRDGFPGSGITVPGMDLEEGPSVRGKLEGAIDSSIQRDLLVDHAVGGVPNSYPMVGGSFGGICPGDETPVRGEHPAKFVLGEFLQGQFLAISKGTDPIPVTPDSEDGSTVPCEPVMH